MFELAAVTLFVATLIQDETEPLRPLEPPAPATDFQTPEERLAERLDALAAADARAAIPLIDEIRALWAHSGSDTISLLMDRGRAAELGGNNDIAARMYDHVTRLDPEFAEGWLASGRVAAGFEDWGYALETLNTALTLEPRRYDAYMALGRVLERAEAYDAALEAYEAALAIYPAYPEAQSAKERLDAAQAGRAL
jgi:tetratricopeptide (TPR) repeat protein